MEIKALQHCGLVVQDLERARRFYGTVLGLTEVPRPRTFKFRGAWFRGTGVELHLIVAADTTAPPGLPDAGPARHTGLATHIAFEVADLVAVVARLREHGVEILGGPMPRGDGVQQLYIQDPDGYLLEFFQWTGEIPDDAPERGVIRRTIADE